MDIPHFACLCTIEKEKGTLFVRMGLNYLRKSVLQNQSNAVSVKAGDIEPLSFVAPMVSSDDFH